MNIFETFGNELSAIIQETTQLIEDLGEQYNQLLREREQQNFQIQHLTMINEQLIEENKELFEYIQNLELKLEKEETKKKAGRKKISDDVIHSILELKKQGKSVHKYIKINE